MAPRRWFDINAEADRRGITVQELLESRLVHSTAYPRRKTVSIPAGIINVPEWDAAQRHARGVLPSRTDGGPT